MLTSELKVVLGVTKEIAVYPTPIGWHLPYEISSNSYRRHYRNFCPTGCVRATVIETGHRYVEKRPVGQCGDRDYEFVRKNGVLVEFDFGEFVDKHQRQGEHFIIRDGQLLVQQDHGAPENHEQYYPHSTCPNQSKDEPARIRMVVSAKACVQAWDEYAMALAKLYRERDEKQQKIDALRNPQAALMGMTRREFDDTHGGGNRSRNTIYLNANWNTKRSAYDEDGNIIRDKNGDRVYLPDIGEISITIDRANEILSVLTKAQKKKLGIPNA